MQTEYRRWKINKFIMLFYFQSLIKLWVLQKMKPLFSVTELDFQTTV